MFFNNGQIDYFTITQLYYGIHLSSRTYERNVAQDWFKVAITRKHGTGDENC